MKNEFQIPNNIQVINKPEDYKPKNIILSERTTNNGYFIPDNIKIFENDIYQETANDLPNPNLNLVGEIDVIEVISDEELPEKGPEQNSDEEYDIWNQIEDDFIDSEFLISDGDDICIDKDKLFSWLKEKLSGISFCQTYLSDKVDGENGIVKENSTLMLTTENGSKFFLNKSGQYHRLDGPAIEWTFGANEYFKNGIRHRLNGAAYENKDEKQYWFEGKQYNESEYWIVSKEIGKLK